MTQRSGSQTTASGLTTQKKSVIARNEAISQLNGFVAAQLAARSVKRRHSREFLPGIHQGLSSL